MKGKKKVFAILAAVLMVFTLMPMSTEPVHAEDISECTVILDPGFIGGQPVTVKSTEEGMMALEPVNQGHGMFQWGGDGMWYRYPDLPETFTVPDGLVFNGWTDGSDTTGHMPGFSTTVDGALTLTAQWAPEKTYDFVIGFTGSSDGTSTAPAFTGPRSIVWMGMRSKYLNTWTESGGPFQDSVTWKQTIPPPTTTIPLTC